MAMGLAAARIYVLTAVLALGAGSASAADDLPPFVGDGRDPSFPVLGSTFTPVTSLPNEAPLAGEDRAALMSMLDNQARALDKAKGEPAATFDGVGRRVTAADLKGTVERLRQWAGSGRPLGEYVQPYILKGDGQGNVRFTGYFTPSIRISDKPSDTFRFPLYRRPVGMAEPLPSRKEIDDGALSGKGLELAWTDDLIGLYFLQVQGSGYGFDTAGTNRLFSYGGKNGHPYVSIGKYLVAQGEITAQEISMAAIKDWFARHPARIREVMDLNPSYSFFTTDIAAVSGAAAVPLVPFRSVAADSSVLPLGAMVLIEMPILDDQGRVASYQPRLMAVQDRGGAIKGVGRIDIYAGAGAKAEDFAGHLKHFGRAWLLLPRP